MAGCGNDARSMAQEQAREAKEMQEGTGIHHYKLRCRIDPYDTCPDGPDWKFCGNRVVYFDPERRKQCRIRLESYKETRQRLGLAKKEGENR